MARSDQNRPGLGVILLLISAAIVISGFLILLPTNDAEAATARFTGRFEVTRTATGRAALNCQYMYGGRYYWYLVPGSRCPASIQVQ